MPIVRIINSLKAKRLQIDVIGMQGYMEMYYSLVFNRDYQLKPFIKEMVKQIIKKKGYKF